MNKNANKSVFRSLIFISLVVFFLYCFPNSTGSDNLAMVRIFEPDEAAVLPVLQKMVTPKDNFVDFIKGFVFYEYYFYGFPFFGLSALVLLPFQWLGQIDNTPMTMLALRQIISVLPMLVALLILVYMQDGFRTYRSILLYVFLLSVPAVIKNGLWLHPDGMVLLLSVLVLYFLWKDERRLGKNFYIASALCGILIATKLVGAFFFLAVGVTVIWSLIEKKSTWKKAILSSAKFIFVMAFFFILSNPFLLSKWGRIEYITTAKKQASFLSEGYGVVYGKGLRSLWPILKSCYGGAIFLIATLFISIISIFNSKQPFLHTLILSWFIPLTIYVFFFTHFKYQYWLPVAIPLYSNWILIFPEEFRFPFKKQKILSLILCSIFVVQFAFFTISDVKILSSQITREENNASILFYERVKVILGEKTQESLHVYFDYRLYVPDDNAWIKETSYDLLTYFFVQEKEFDVLLLQKQRIMDYLQEGIEGIDPKEFELSQQFYRDANEGNLKGYELIYRDETGLIFIKSDKH